jgi:hypothetical protein
MPMITPDPASATEPQVYLDGTSVPKTYDFSQPWLPVPPVPVRSLAEIHADQAEAALAAFEKTGDFRHGLAALVHAILSIDIREAGNR